jgi:hypothetical protein
VEPEARPELFERIRGVATPLRSARDLDPLLQRIGDARLVLLGEASHGTAEYYEWRAEISRRLITEKGFRFIAVEGDWPSCDRLDQYIKGRGADDAREALQAFDRWPTWMWANEEVAELANWLKAQNRGRQEPVGFHGLDVYSLWDSLYAVIGYLSRVDPGAVDAARRAFRCFVCISGPVAVRLNGRDSVRQRTGRGIELPALILSGAAMPNEPTPDSIPEPTGPTIPEPGEPRPSDFPEIPKPQPPDTPFPVHPKPSPGEKPPPAPPDPKA